MTGVCGGGVSEAKAGFARAVQITPYVLGALLNNVPTPWAVALAVLLGVESYELSTFCLSDPPTLPVLTLADGLALVNPTDFIPYTAAVLKMRDFVGYYAWYQFCQCHTGTATPPGAPQAEPIGWPQTDPAFTGFPQLSTPCASGVGTITSVSSGSSTTNRGGCAVPPGGSYYRLSAVDAVVSGTGCTSQYTLRALDASFATIGSITTDVFPASGSHHFIWQGFPVNATFIVPDVVGVTGTGTSSVVPTSEVWCNGQFPGSAPSPCCPPDPSLVAQLGQVLAMVTLIQRRLAPFAYIAGSAHAGLSGQGTIVVNGLIGLKVAITTLPASYGSSVGEPTYGFLGSWLSVLTGDGLIDERRVTSTSQVWTPRLASESTLWGYSFAPGIIATITELEAEP